MAHFHILQLQIVYFLKVPLQKRGAQKTRPGSGARQKSLILSLIFRLTAGFGTTLSQVAGLHRAVPSTALDKVFNCDCIISVFPCLSIFFHGEYTGMIDSALFYGYNILI